MSHEFPPTLEASAYQTGLAVLQQEIVDRGGFDGIFDELSSAMRVNDRAALKATLDRFTFLFDAAISPAERAANLEARLRTSIESIEPEMDETSWSILEGRIREGIDPVDKPAFKLALDICLIAFKDRPFPGLRELEQT